MNARTKQLLDEVLELPESELSAFASELDARLEGKSDLAAEKAWAQEIVRRATEVVEGRGRGRDAREALDDVRARFLAMKR